jgi:hypothetical protein
MRPDIWPKIRKDALEQGQDCPALERWGAWLDGTLGAAERETMDAHRRDCARCDAEVEMMRSFLAAEPAAHEAADVEWIAGRLRGPKVEAAEPRQSFWQWLFSPGGYRMLADAALLVVVAGAALEWRRRAAPVLDGPAGGAFRSLAPVEVLSEQGDLARAPETLRWRAVDGAAGYVVRVMEVDDRVVWEGRSVGAGLTVPAEASKLFVPHKTLVVVVQAVGADGRVLTESARVRMRVLPERK